MDNCFEKCKTCKYIEQEKITEGLKDNYSNWLCTYGNKKSVICLSMLDSKPLKLPIWCPLYSTMVKIGTANTNVKEEKKKMNNSEKRSILEKMKPMIEWEDIKEHEVYHIPPLLYDERRDIIVLEKNDIYLTYTTLSKDKEKASSERNKLYKNMLITRFLTKHKIQDIEVVTK